VSSFQLIKSSVSAPVQVDQIMWTHWPTDEDEAKYPGLRAAVEKFMTHHHTPQCGGVDGKCRWKFPQPPHPFTTRADDGRWQTWRGSGERDGWIPAYHPLLLLRLQCHCNFQVTNGTATIGYLFKYPLKGDATIRACLAEVECGAPSRRDEITNFQTLRVVSASEALFHILEYTLAVTTPPVRSVKVRSNLHVLRKYFFELKSIFFVMYTRIEH
jgi:hypothetical protein